MAVVALASSGPGAAADGIGPSFSCDKAETTTEKAICASPELAALDLAMARAYDALREARPGEHDSILAAQRAAMAQRDKCGATVPCIESVISARIAAMIGGLGTAGKAPAVGSYDAIADGVTGTLTIAQSSGDAITADAGAVDSQSTDQCSASGALKADASAGGYGFTDGQGHLVSGGPVLTALGDLIVLTGGQSGGTCGANVRWPVVWSR